MEKIISLQNKSIAKKEIEDFFKQYSKLPAALVSCPVGLYRSEVMAYYLEANKLAFCPINNVGLPKVRRLSGVSFKNVEFSIKNGDIYSTDLLRKIEDRVDIAVFCDDFEISNRTYRNGMIERVNNRIPVLVLEGLEGSFTYFCSDTMNHL